MAERAELVSAVHEIIAEHAPDGHAAVTSETLLVEDLGFDSMALADLVVAFGIELELEPPEDAQFEGIETVGDITAFVLAQLGQHAVSS